MNSPLPYHPKAWAGGTWEASEPRLLTSTNQNGSQAQQTLRREPSRPLATTLPGFPRLLGQLIKNTDFLFFNVSPREEGQAEGKKNTTGIGRKLANALYFYKCFKNNTWVVFVPYPHLSFFSGSTHLSWQTAEPSAIWHPSLNDTCSNLH